MTVTCPASGTHTPSGYTETILKGINSEGVYSFHVDLSNMQSGDTVELRIYQAILSTGTAQCAYFQSFSGAQESNNLIAVSVPIANELTISNALKFTIKQTAGTYRAFYWKVLKY